MVIAGREDREEAPKTRTTGLKVQAQRSAAGIHAARVAQDRN